MCRLENERRSTPIQQFNDLHFAIRVTPWLNVYMAKCNELYSVSDAGWDHSPRVPEVQWVHTRSHLVWDRDYDSALTRSKGQSGRNEAERVQSVTTGAITRGSVAGTVKGMALPSGAEELTSNRCRVQYKSKIF